MSSQVFHLCFSEFPALWVFQDVKALHEALGNTDDALAASLVPWTRVWESQIGREEG